MSKLRVLLVSRSLPFHGLGGMEVVAWDLAQAFVRKGIAVTIMTTACPALPEDSVQNGVRIKCLDVPSGRYSREWWHASKLTFDTEYAGGFDVVLSISAGAKAIARDRRAPYPLFFVQAHGTSWGEFVSKLRLPSPLAWVKASRNVIGMIGDVGYRHFDAFVAVGTNVKSDLLRAPTKHVVGNRPVFTISNGIQPEQFEYSKELRKCVRDRLGIPEGAKTLISVSRLHHQKGLREAITAFAAVSNLHPSMHYIIVGTGPDEKHLLSMTRRMNLTDRVHFMGAIPRDLLRQYLSAADLFMFSTTRLEGLPMNVLEALASGLPAILSHHINDPRFRSVGVNPRDTDSLTQAILQCEAHQERYSRLPLELTLDHSASEYIKLFKKFKNSVRLSN